MRNCSALVKPGFWFGFASNSDVVVSSLMSILGFGISLERICTHMYAFLIYLP
jgi:hypothetical protein